MTGNLGIGSHGSSKLLQVLEEIRDHVDVEMESICIKDDPNESVLGLVKKCFKKTDGLEDYSKREYYKGGAVIPAPTVFTYGTCGASDLKTFNFSVTPNLKDNLEEDYAVSLAGIIDGGSYDLIQVNPQNGVFIEAFDPNTDEIIVTIYNNSGTVFNAQLDFILKQV